MKKFEQDGFYYELKSFVFQTSHKIVALVDGFNTTDFIQKYYYQLLCVVPNSIATDRTSFQVSEIWTDKMLPLL